MKDYKLVWQEVDKPKLGTQPSKESRIKAAKKKLPVPIKYDVKKTTSTIPGQKFTLQERPPVADNKINLFQALVIVLIGIIVFAFLMKYAI